MSLYYYRDEHGKYHAKKAFPDAAPTPDPLKYNLRVAEIGQEDAFYAGPDRDWILRVPCRMVRPSDGTVKDETQLLGQLTRCWVDFDPAYGRHKTIAGGESTKRLCFASVRLELVEPPDDPTWDDNE